MRKLAVALLAVLPALALAQEPAPPADAASPAAEPPAATPGAQPQAAEWGPPSEASPPPQAPPAPQYAPPAPPYAPPPPPPATPPPPPPATPPRPPPPAKQRGSWYIGFGLGSGDGTVAFADGTRAGLDELVTGSGDRFAFNFRVGGTLTPKLLLGFDGGFIAADGSDDSSVQLNTYDVGVMFFPRERGLYLRGAFGRSVLMQSLPGLGDVSTGGFNVVGGLGYAFWLGRTFNLTLNVEGHRHWFNGAGVDGATAWAGWLGFDWY